ncbi:MAG: hypothetical protein KF887_08370 [Paracoccaceae bacterium]|nr:MAG: hypothetical protein KF887_08370 [Paracoccaceae bacterium]
MRAVALAIGLVVALSPPLRAQEAAPGGDDGFSLMEEGARLLFRGLMQEMEPALDEMGRALQDIEPALREMGPKLRQLVDLMGDVTQYEAPERMPNGDILIRRRPGAPPPPALPGLPAPQPQGEIEL